MIDQLYELERKILYKELKPLFEELKSIRYAVVKGEVLSQQIYGVPNRRRSGDIDILIDKKNVKRLEEILHKLDFIQKLPENSAEARLNRVLCMAYSHQIPSYHKEKYGFDLNVDINYDIFWGEYEGERCSIDEFLKDTVNMEIYGVEVKTLPLTKSFVQLILHHYKEMNSLYHLSRHHTIRTDMFRDVYEMLKKIRVDEDHIIELCDKYNIGKYVYYMVYYAHKIFGEYLCPYLEALKSYEDIELLESFGLAHDERKKWLVSFEERLDNEMLNKLIENQLTDKDIRKISLNNKIFD